VSFDIEDLSYPAAAAAASDSAVSLEDFQMVSKTINNSLIQAGPSPTAIQELYQHHNRSVSVDTTTSMESFTHLELYGGRRTPSPSSLQKSLEKMKRL
jgi:hypothetical protein